MWLRAGLRLRLCPVAPRMSVERILAIRFEKFHELFPLDVREARADADVFEISIVVVEAEQRGADFGFFAGLVPGCVG